MNMRPSLQFQRMATLAQRYNSSAAVNPAKPVRHPGSEEAAIKLTKGGVVHMFNFLQFREQADYGERSEKPCTGRVAYEERFLPLLRDLFKDPQISGKVLHYGHASMPLVGPQEEKWDAILVAAYPNIDSFLALTKHKKYLDDVGHHRLAALTSWKLIPSSPQVKWTSE